VSGAHGFYDGLVRRPVTLLVIFVALLVIGVLAYIRIPVQMMPEGLVEPSLQVWIANPGASAQENEQKVVRIIEEQLRTLPGIEGLDSTASDDSAFTFVRFDASTNMELAKAEVRDRVERARPQAADERAGNRRVLVVELEHADRVLRDPASG
jgi:multidrug efflux pump subunit AcrB